MSLFHAYSTVYITYMTIRISENNDFFVLYLHIVQYLQQNLELFNTIF
jgi:hypothetical protein